MLYTNVPERKRHFSKGEYINGYWFAKQQKDNNNDFIRAQRYKQKAIDTMVPGFWEAYANSLNIVCALLSEELTQKLKDLILERAYTNSSNSDYWYENGHRPTYEFANAWEVIVYVGRTGTLHFDMKYNWQDMDVDVAPRNENNNNLSHYSLHAGTFGNARGRDMREALADILNMPSSVTYVYSTKTRRGRWQETFLQYCRSDGVARFRSLCQDYGIL